MFLGLYNSINKINFEQVKYQITVKILNNLCELFRVCYMNDPLVQTKIFIVTLLLYQVINELLLFILYHLRYNLTSKFEVQLDIKHSTV